MRFTEEQYAAQRAANALHEAEQEREEVMGETAAFRKAAEELKSFARHMPQCGNVVKAVGGSLQIVCDCGYEEALARIEAERGEG